MNLDDLRYFVEAAQRENLSHAAKALAVTQSTVSHAIRRLETDLGTELFQKFGRELRLTSPGRLLAERAAHIVREVGALKRVGADAAAWPKRVRAGATLGLPARLLVRAWYRLAPAATSGLWTQSLRSGDVLARLSKRDLDIGLCFGPQPYPGVKLEVIATCDLVAAARHDHPLLAMPEAERRERLQRYGLAAAEPKPGIGSCSQHPVFALTGAETRPVTGFDDYDVAGEILRHTDLWAVLPRAVVQTPEAGLADLFTGVSEPLALALAWPDGDDLGGLPHSLAASLRHICGETGWLPTPPK